MPIRWARLATTFLGSASLLALACTWPAARASTPPNQSAPPLASQPAARPPAATQPSVSSQPIADAELFVNLPVDAALRKAAAEKKVVFIDFYTTWCVPCKLLDKLTFTDPTVRSFLRQHTIPLRVDAEAEKAVAARWSVALYPSLLLIKPDGTLQGRVVGFQPPQALLNQLGAALGLPRDQIPQVPSPTSAPASAPAAEPSAP
jgi:thiol:disulfide interchange protein